MKIQSIEHFSYSLMIVGSVWGAAGNLWAALLFFSFALAPWIWYDAKKDKKL